GLCRASRNGKADVFAIRPCEAQRPGSNPPVRRGCYTKNVLHLSRAWLPKSCNCRDCTKATPARRAALADRRAVPDAGSGRLQRDRSCDLRPRELPNGRCTLRGYGTATRWRRRRRGEWSADLPNRLCFECGGERLLRSDRHISKRTADYEVHAGNANTEAAAIL